jgi:hypothetical protein
MVWLLANWKIVAVGLALAWGGIEHYLRTNLEHKIAEERLATEKAISKAKDDAKAKSDELILKQAEVFAKNAQTTNTTVERIVNVPVAYDCTKSQAIQLGLAGARQLLDDARARGTAQTIGIVNATLQRAPGSVR